jgi:hypothetical protein
MLSVLVISGGRDDKARRDACRARQGFNQIHLRFLPEVF